MYEHGTMSAWLLESTERVIHGKRGVFEERERAHDKHRDHSMESWPALSPERYLILAEEVGEVAKEFNDAKVEGRDIDAAALRAELVQVAAMAVAWAAALDGGMPSPLVRDPGRTRTDAELHHQAEARRGLLCHLLHGRG